VAETAQNSQRGRSQIAIQLLRLRAKLPGRRLRLRKPVDIATMLGITALFWALYDDVTHWAPASLHRTIVLYACRAGLGISAIAAFLSVSVPPVERKDGFDLSGWLSGRTQVASNTTHQESDQGDRPRWSIWERRQEARRQQQADQMGRENQMDGDQ
jgi:hypothetical protein